MRQTIVASLLVLGLSTSAALLAFRTRTPHVRTLAPALPEPVPSGSVAVGVVGSGTAVPPGASSAVTPSLSVGSVAPPVGSGAPVLDRTLRVAVLGWELAVPLVMANQGLEPSAQSVLGKAGLEVKVTVTDHASAIEQALARGGADRDGADVAVLPLPTFVAAYERLRALSPEVFLVVGWSRGRDALMASKDLLASPPSGDVTMAGDEGAAATFLGLWALDLAGVQAPKLKLVPASKAPEAMASAQDRSSPFEGAHRQVLMSTAEASRLIPYVAIAQHALIERQGAALTAWARGWLGGQKQVEADPAAAARTVGATGGAPGPLPLLKGLGEMQASSLNDGARAMGLAGRSGVSVESLFQQSWRVWRASGVLTGAAPEAAPIATTIVAALARSEGAPPATNPPRAGSDKGKPLLVYRQKAGEVDEAALESMVGLLAGAFERSALRVTLKKGASVDAGRVRKLLDSAQGTYDIAPARLIVGTKTPDKADAAIEVFPAP